MQMALRRESYNFDDVLQDKCGSAETAMRDCGRAMGTDMSVCAGIGINLFEMYRTLLCNPIQQCGRAAPFLH